MKQWYEIMLDEKIVTCTMIILLSFFALLLIHWNADKEYIIPIFGSAITTLVGSLVRGTTHQSQQADSSQSVSSTTTITPKE